MSTFAAGLRLGPYELLSSIGAGGMGEVWKARDTRLNRLVAIKVLPSEFAANEERRRRFELEARAVAALNHPNIVALFDVGDSWVVTELLEGEPLRAAIGHLSVRKAIDIASQVAQGLAAAHIRGIIHRDLKPENIFLLKDGRAKILDFGLAKQSAVIGEDESTGLMDAGDTIPGQVMGTIGYMSPEQIRGQAVDHRSDIFSFGLVLYEMLTGERAFRGATTADTMSAVLSADVPELPTAVPILMARIVHRCLEKEPARRFQSAADLGFALDSLNTGSTTVASPDAPPRRTSRRDLLWASGATALAGSTFAAGYFLKPGEHDPPRFRSIPTQDLTLFVAGAIHPDGRSVVYGANVGGEPHLFYQEIEGGIARDLKLPPGSYPLSISVRGDLAFFVGFAGTLYRTPLASPAPRPVLENVDAAIWSPAGDALLVLRKLNGKYRIEYPIGNVIYESEIRLLVPCLSRRSDRVAFIESVRDAGPQLVMLDSSRQKTVAHSFPKGHSVYQWRLFWSPDEREVWAKPLEGGDGSALIAYGPGGKRRVVTRLPGDVWPLDISARGDMLMLLNWFDGRVRAMPPNGEREQEIALDALPHTLSSDGRTLIMAVCKADTKPDQCDIYVQRLDGSAPVLLGSGYAEPAVISPDNKWVQARRDEVSVLMPTGPGEEQKIQVPGLEKPYIVAWIPGGQKVLVSGIESGHRRYFVWQPGEQHPTRVRLEYYAIYRVIVSPDGRHLAVLNTFGRWLLYPIVGGDPVALPGIALGDNVYGWTADSQSLYAGKAGISTLVIDRYNVDTGQRTRWKEFSSGRPDTRIASFCLTPDGRAWAYALVRTSQRLLIAQGLH